MNRRKEPDAGGLSGYNRRQRRQIGWLETVRRAHRGADRAQERGAPLYRIFRRLRHATRLALLAALDTQGRSTAGALPWPALLQAAREQLDFPPEGLAALAVLEAMPRRPEEPAWRDSREDLLCHIAEGARYRQAAWRVYAQCARLVAGSLGFRDGHWLRHQTQGVLFLLEVDEFLQGLVAPSASGLTRTLPLIECFGRGEAHWITDPADIASLDDTLTTPVAFQEVPDPDSLPLDPEREAMHLLLRTGIAGLYYHKVRSVAEALEPGLRLQLLREPENPFDVDAVVVLLEGVKLGYVPRRCNNDISGRLARGVELGAWVARVLWDDDKEEFVPGLVGRYGPAPDRAGRLPEAVLLEIRSPLAQDAPSPAEERETRAWAAREPVKPLPEEEGQAESYWPAHFTRKYLEEARQALARGDRRGVLLKLGDILNWAREAWLWQHGHKPQAGWGWQGMENQFRQAAAATDFALRLDLLSREIGWHCRDEAASSGTPLALALLRLENLLLRQVPEPADDGGARQGLAMMLRLPEPGTSPVHSCLPLARRYTPWRRLETLRLLRRLLRIEQRCVAGLAASTGELDRLRPLNRDALLVKAFLRRLILSLAAEQRALLKPDEAGQCWEPDAHFLACFPLLVPNRAKWAYISRAASLLEREDWPEDDMARLGLELRQLQPESRRRGRRKPRDRDLYLAEQILLSAQRLDLRPALFAATLLMPMIRQDRLRPDMLRQVFDILGSELFGLDRQALLTAWPALTAEAGDLEFALSAWQRATAATRDPEALATDPEAQAAQALLEEALISFHGPWRDALRARIPALECLCPWPGSSSLQCWRDATAERLSGSDGAS